jgi:DNA-binding protein YbaB
VERPNWNVLHAILGDLRRATARLPDLQQRMLAVTGVAWSTDRMIKAVVGPRGHLLELEIDPRLLRRPDSKALAASIVATVKAAVEDAGEQSRALLEESLPADLRANRFGDTDLTRFVGRHDEDVRVTGGHDDE